MGLALNSDEVQKNLALVPVGDNVRMCFYSSVLNYFTV